jgi:hypothetical protein
MKEKNAEEQGEEMGKKTNESKGGKENGGGKG